MRKEWVEAMAEVTECRYDVRAGRALAFGLTSDKHFRIVYNYCVGDELRTGECFSEVARPQGSLFVIHYDPNVPDVSHVPAGSRVLPVIAVGVAGSVVLSLVLLGMRGC